MYASCGDSAMRQWLPFAQMCNTKGVAERTTRMDRKPSIASIGILCAPHRWAVLVHCY
jgi:hypothetical protein